MADPAGVTDGSLKLSLGGMVALLRGHWRDTPHVFVRELLRLAAGSVAARDEAQETVGSHAQHSGRLSEIHLQLVEPSSGGLPTLLVEDNGIGLTEDEVRHGLATIGGCCRAMAGDGSEAGDGDGGDLV